MSFTQFFMQNPFIVLNCVIMFYIVERFIFKREVGLSRLLNFGLISALIFIVVPYFFFGEPKVTANKSVVSGDFIQIAPESSYVKPCVYSIMSEIIDQSESVNAKKVAYQHKDMLMEFSEHGGSLTGLFYKPASGEKNTIAAYNILPEVKFEKLPFFVALNNLASPVQYNIVQNDNLVILEGENEHVTVVKIFEFIPDSYSVNFECKIIPKNIQNLIQARIVVPYMDIQSVARPDEKVYALNNGVFSLNAKGKFIKTTKAIDVAIEPPIVGVQNTYFVVSFMQDPHNHLVQRAYLNQAEDSLFLETPVISNEQTFKMRLYIGPKVYGELVKADKHLENVLEFGWFTIISKFLLKLLTLIYSYINSYGFAIIIVSILIRLFLFVLGYLGKDGEKRHAEMQNKHKYLKAKYANDPERLRIEQMKLIQEHGFLPGGLSLLQKILQGVLFFAMSRILQNSILLYKSEFLWIPDLSLPDPLKLIPLIAALVLYFQITVNMEAKHKMWMLILASIVFSIFTNFAAGLVLSIVTSMGLGLLQLRLFKF